MNSSLLFWAWQETGKFYYKDIAEKRIELTKKILNKWIEENNKNNQYLIPVWDFRLPAETPTIGCGTKGPSRWDWDEKDIANLKINVDSSAAAIMCCAIQLINELEPNAELMEYGDKMLQSLYNNCLSTDESILGLIGRQNGCNDYTTYGALFFMEALAKRVYGTPVCWYQPKNN